MHLKKFLFILLSVNTMCFSHPKHITYTEMEYNTQENTIEMSLQLNITDLYFLEDEKSIYDNNSLNLVMNYVNTNLQLSTFKDKKLIGHLVGHEVEGTKIWLYIVYKDLPINLEGLKVSNFLFLERNAHQLNHVQVKLGQSNNDLYFSAEQSKPQKITF